MTKELLTILHRIERVADIISNDKAGGYQWNNARANEIKTLVGMATRLVQEPLNNGK